MSWSATSYYQPSFSPAKRLGLAMVIMGIIFIQCLIGYWENGLTPSFTLLAGLAITAAFLEWKHYCKPREIHLIFDEGRLVYHNLFTREKHTVYQSRTEWIKREGGDLIFYTANSFSTRIPLKFFSEEQQIELLNRIHFWQKRMVDNGKE
jgi:hypothetical protein